jgi:16S rRNA (adenine1518-N6/adenine1519-N6)-dimethyltransferase
MTDRTSDSDPPRRAKKSLGQNFLVDPNIQRKIVDAAKPIPQDEILEIGPGQGALTHHLAGRCGRLVLVELDDALFQELAVRYQGEASVEVVHGDFLEVDLQGVSEDPGALKVIGNIPYNITAPLIFKLLERPRPKELLIMVQREVADRILSPPGTRSYGAMAVGVRSVAEVERVMNVPRKAFRPVPKVDSTVIRIVPHRPPKMSEAEERSLRTLTRVAFQWRRKQFQTILRNHPELGLSREEVEEVQRETSFDLTARPETFSPEELLRLATAVIDPPKAGAC